MHKVFQPSGNYLGSHWKNSGLEIGETLTILIPRYKDKI